MPSSQTYIFRTCPKILLGLESARETGKEIKNLGSSHPLVVTDKALQRVGVLTPVNHALTEAGLSYEIFDGVGSEPTVDHVQTGSELYHRQKCDGIIAIGGGSCLDAGKAIAILATNPGPIQNYEGWDKYPNPKARMIAIPTTAGTGSEVTQTSVITDEQRKLKMRILSAGNIPDVAIEDATLTAFMPAAITAGTGMDALTHAIEGYVSIRSQPLTDVLAIPAIEKISTFLPIAFANGRNLEARSQMMLGQLLAAMAFTNASTALVHGMARTLGAFFHVPHGMSNAILLPHVMEFTMLSVPEKFARIAQAMGETITGLSLREAAEKAISAVRKLCADLEIPSLQDVGVTEETIPELARDVLSQPVGTPSLNPRLAGLRDMEAIFRRAFRKA